MKILGVDYGKSKIGLAIADDESRLALPYSTIRFESEKEAIEKLEKIIKSEDVEKIVVGLPNGEIALKAKDFGKLLGGIGFNVLYQDETFSTKEAQKMSIEAGIKRKKRKANEDAYAAALILQDYLDSNV